VARNLRIAIAASAVRPCTSSTAALDHRYQENAMLRWAVTFFIIAIIAALLGFGGIAGAATNIAMLLFWVFVVLFVLALLAGLVGGKKTPVP